MIEVIVFNGDCYEYLDDLRFMADQITALLMGWA